MVKKFLSIILSTLIVLSCYPLNSQALSIGEYFSIPITATKNSSFDVVVSIDPVDNVQGIVLNIDKAYSKFMFKSYEVLDDSHGASVFVNTSPADDNYSHIMASLNFPDGGVKFTQKTDILKFTFRARSNATDYPFGFRVAEIYDGNLKDIDAGIISIKSGDTEVTEKKLSSLKITAPTKTTYNIGEQFSKSGLTVTAVYSDSSTKVVTDYTVTEPDMSTSGNKTVTVSYTEDGVTQTGTFTIKVNEKTISDLAVTTLPTKTTYYVGETLNTSGMVVTATYSDGSKSNVTSSVAGPTGFDNTKTGAQTLSVSFQGLTATFSVTVKAVEVSSISVKTMPSKTEYYVGESFVSTGLSLTATKSNGTTETVTSGMTCSGFSSTSAGTKTITVSYGGKTTTFNVTVKAVEVTKIELTSKPSKLTYYVNESFSSAGAKVVATYNNGTTADVTSSTTYSGFSSASAGTKTITASYGGKQTTFTVTVKAVEITSISLTSKPTKTTYYVGDTFSSAGAKVTASYNNGTTSDVTGSAVFSGYDKTKTGTQTITVSYSGKTTTFTVTVKAALSNSNAYVTINGVVSTSETQTMKIGQTAKITGSASGGSGSYKYAFYYRIKDASSWQTEGTEFGTATSADFSPVNQKTYEYKVKVKDSDGNVAEKVFEISVGYSDLTNKSSISNNTDQICVGDTVTIKGAAAGGSGSYKYTYSYKKNADSTWTNISSETTSTSVSFVPDTATTYNVKVIAADASSSSTAASATSTFNFTAKAKLVNNSTVEKTQYYVGDKVNITGAASGGIGSYTYTYSYKKSSESSYTTIQNSTGTSASFTPDTETNYNIRIVVKDTNSRTATKDYTVNVGAALKNTSTLGASKYYLEDSVIIKGSATGGSGSYKYTYYYRSSSGSTWTSIGSAETSSVQASFTPSAAGSYDVRVIVKDSGNRTSEKILTVSVGDALKNTSTVDSTQHYLNDTVTLKGSATGGSGSYKYTYSYKKSTDSSWTTIGTADTTSATATFKPSAVAAYNVKIVVKDSGNRTKEASFNVSVGNALVNNSTLNSSQYYAGDTVKITASAAGGATPYTYTYSYKKNSDSSWTAIGSANTSSTSASFIPASAADYDVKVTVKDNGGRTADKTITVKVGASVVNTSSVDYTQRYVGDKVTVKGSATGGAGSYKYTYYYKKKADTSWTAIGSADTASTTASFTIGSLSNYDVKITVKDKDGRTADKTISINVGAAVSNTSKLNETSVYLGDKLTILGSATGGSGNYRYAYYYRESSASEWTKIGTEFGTAVSAAFTPAKSVKYDIKVIVKDGDGRQAEKTLSVTVGSKLTNSSTISANQLYLKDKLTFTGKATGGSGGYTYEYYYKLASASSWTKLSSASWTPTAAGSYNVKVKVTDKATAIGSRTAEKTFNVTVSATFNNVSVISGTQIYKGDTLTLTGKAEGGNGAYRYAFLYKQSSSSSWVTLGEAFGSATTASVKLSTVTDYDIKIVVKDSVGTRREKTFKVNVCSLITDKSTVSVNDVLYDGTAKVYTNDTVTVNGAAEGGRGGYKYAFYYKQHSNTSWNLLGTEFGAETSASFKPTAVTTYDILVRVKDKNGRVVRDELGGVVVSYKSMTNKSTVSSASIYAGDTLTINGAVAGGAGGYKYTYWYKQSKNSSWIVIGTANMADTSVTLKPSVVTNYDIKVRVKDKFGRTAEKTLTVNVAYAALLNKSTVSAKKIYAGDTIDITGAAEGGKGGYKYAFYYKQHANSSWIAIDTEFGADTKVTLTPKNVTTYDILVKVKDSNGRVTKKTINVDVTNPELINSSSISTTKLYSGEKLTLTGNASGGSGDYKYAFYYKQSAKEGWIAIGDTFAAEKTASIKLSNITDYDIMISVKDSNGRIVKKTFKITVYKQLANNSTISAKSLVQGNELTLTGEASGGTGGYKYAFYYKQSAKAGWIAIGDVYGTATTAKIKLSNLTSYDIMIALKDSNGKAVKKNFTVNVVTQLVNKSTTNTRNLYKGDTLVLTGLAEGGKGSYKYAFYYKQQASESWIAIGELYDGKDTAEIKLGNLTTYDIMIRVRDESGQTAEKRFDVNVLDTLVNKSTISTTKMYKGEILTFTGAASGGASGYKYTYYYKQSSYANWNLIGETDSLDIRKTLTPGVVTTYDIMIRVRDNNNRKVDKTFTVNVIGVKNTSTISTDKFSIGDTINLNGSAELGEGAYTYKFYYKQSTSSQWHEFDAKFINGTTATIKPQYEKDYNFRVVVTDAKGSTDEKTFTVKYAAN